MRFNDYEKYLEYGAIISTSSGCSDMDIRVGETFTHSYELPYSKDLIKDLTITYTHNGHLILMKYMENTSINGSIMFYTLSEEETMRFERYSDVNVQIKLLLINNEIIMSDVKTIHIVPSSNLQSIDRLTLNIPNIILGINGRTLHAEELQDMYIGNSNKYYCELYLDTAWEKYQSCNLIIYDDLGNSETLSITSTHCKIVIPSIFFESPRKLSFCIESIEGDLKDRTNISNSIKIKIN